MPEQTSSAFKLLRGTLRKDREPQKASVDNAYTFPLCPRHFTKEHKKVWNSVKKEMAQYKLITGADVALLEQYCILITQLRTNSEAFTASLHAQLRGLANDLYLTPDSRRKAGVTAEEKEEDPLKKYGL